MSDTDLPDDNNGSPDANEVGADDLIAEAELDPDVTKVYVNSAAGMCSRADFAILFSRTGIHKVLVYMSLRSAERLADGIQDILEQMRADIEDDNGHEGGE